LDETLFLGKTIQIYIDLFLFIVYNNVIHGIGPTVPGNTNFFGGFSIMKKILSLLVVAVLMLGMMSVSVSATRDLVYTAPFATAVVDGVMEDAWTTAEWTNIDLPHDGTKDDVSSARARIMHDDQYLYYLVEATDATVAEGNGDGFEIYFDEDCCADVAYCDVSTQLVMHLDGQVTKGANSLGDVDMVKEYVVTTTSDGYLLEFKVELLNGIPASKTLNIEFMYNNNDEAGGFLGADRWNVDTNAGDTAPWQAPECWGELYCAEYVEPEVPEVDEPAVDAPADTTAPTTADAGIVVAAVVMAAAAAVVCKKH